MCTFSSNARSPRYFFSKLKQIIDVKHVLAQIISITVTSSLYKTAGRKKSSCRSPSSPEASGLCLWNLSSHDRIHDIVVIRNSRRVCDFADTELKYIGDLPGNTTFPLLRHHLSRLKTTHPIRCTCINMLRRFRHPRVRTVRHMRARQRSVQLVTKGCLRISTGTSPSAV